MDNKRPTESDYDEVGLRRPPDELNTGETYWQAATALQRGIERYRIDQEYWAKKEWERRPETVECAGCQSSIPVKATGWLPKWCETCNPKNAPVTQRQLRLAREAAIPSYPTDQACVACNRRVRGSGATDKYSRWVAHITHFEVYHYSGTRRRDAARLKRAQREGTGRVDEDVREIDVLRRDGYTCQMCGYPIILNQRPRHRKGPSIDHIEWLSQGGDHTMDNVQAAHLGCNVRPGYAVVRARTAKANRSAAAKRGWETRRKRQNRYALEMLGAWAVVVTLVLVVLFILDAISGSP
ncbi:MAG: HNH endonuclease signature motif containing protein [Actinomycetota bacterium]|nr:HNH endonuclease signature motif containing protein [Actinomycetota bacterium]